jgi:hypothetical protein
MKYLTTKAMVIAKSSWFSIRMIDKRNGRTVYEYTVVRPGHTFPTGVMGNRKIIENETALGVKTFINDKKNIDLITVCILPEVDCSHEETILIKLIIDFAEMYFLLYRNGSIASYSNGSNRENLQTLLN